MSDSTESVLIRDDTFVLLERLHVDRELLTRFVLNPDIRAVVNAEGFEIADHFLGILEKSIKKIRTYMADQVYLLTGLQELQRTVAGPLSPGGENGAVDW